MSAFRKVTAPYSWMEAWGYDHFIGAKAAELLRPTVLKAIEPHLSSTSVLDVGCGGGHLLVSLADANPEWSVTGVDLNLGQVNRARARGRRLGKRVTVEVGSATALPFEDATFDAVVSITSIKHWSDQLAGVKEVIRVLRPGGRFFIAEVHRGAKSDEVTRFVSDLGIPSLLHVPMSNLFRKFVLARGWVLEDGEQLASAVPLMNFEISQLDVAPLIAIIGAKS